MNKENTIPVPQLNARVLDSLERDPLCKEAQAAATNYTRTGIREDSFAFKILPPEQATNDMLTPAMDEGTLQILWEIAPESAGAKWVALEGNPEGEYITSSRYIIPFARVVTNKYSKNLDELRTTKQDVRKILTDESIKDGLERIDNKWIGTVNSIVFNCELDNTDPLFGINKVTGKRQLLDLADGLNRRSFAEAKKMLPRGNAQGMYRLRNHCCLMNEATAQDWLKLGRDQVGDDRAGDMFFDGLKHDTIMGVKHVFTLKDDLIPDNYVYFFAAPDFLGKCFYLTDWTMFMKKEAWYIEFFNYWLGGFAFGNVAGMALARFDQTGGVATPIDG